MCKYFGRVSIGSPLDKRFIRVRHKLNIFKMKSLALKLPHRTLVYLSAPVITQRELNTERKQFRYSYEYFVHSLAIHCLTNQQKQC